jgi:hypothetical protein
MNEGIHYILAEVAIALAGFSGVAAAFRVREAYTWSATERRILWLLIGDSLLVLFFSLIPVALALSDLSQTMIWSICNATLGSWFIIGDILAIRGELRDRKVHQLVTVPLITPILYTITVVAFIIGITLWLSALDFIVPRGQAMYVIGLIILLAFAAVEFLFFIGLASQQGRK